MVFGLSTGGRMLFVPTISIFAFSVVGGSPTTFAKAIFLDKSLCYVAFYTIVQHSCFWAEYWTIFKKTQNTISIFASSPKEKVLLINAGEIRCKAI